jgi:citryl-CoA lyase
MEFKTTISKMTADDLIVRGKKLSDLMVTASFSDVIFLILVGRMPTEQESKVVAAMLIGVIDHGMGTTSSMTTRFVASGGNRLQTAVGAGILALGEYHGGAIEQSMEQLQSAWEPVKDLPETDQGRAAARLVTEAIASKTPIYGFGHAVYKEVDPRVKQLQLVCDQAQFISPILNFARLVETELVAQKGKTIPLNVDGAIAAILLDMGLTPLQGRGLFIAARAPGLVAQAIEELTTEKPVRRVDEADITYIGE